jgi:hypothetical protein
MIIDNKIERTFGGPLLIMGLTFMAIAVVMIFSHRYVLAIVGFIIAGFILFTYSGIDIDIEKRRIKPYYMIFGLLKRGKWESLNKFLGLTLVPMKKVSAVYSRSNRRNTSIKNDFRVYLVNRSKKPAYPLKTCKTREEAQNSMDEFAIWLKLPVYSVKKHHR